MAKPKILIIEDEKDIVELMRYNLEREGYQCLTKHNAEEALNAIHQEPPDLILLDLMLPGMDGLEACRLIRQDPKSRQIPIIMLTAKSEESDVVVGLQLGADDYVTKPFSPKVLIARIKAVFRRLSGKSVLDELRKFDSLTIDIPKHKVKVQGRAVELTTIEFNILEFLSRSPGRVFTRDQIMDKVWKEGRFIVDRAVDVHVRGLRKKLEESADCIETVRGVGYRFKEAGEDEQD